MKTYGGVDVQIHIFLTSALDGGEWSASHPGRFTPRETNHGTHWIGGWVGPRTGLDDIDRSKILPLPGLELQPLGLPARSQSLYQLHYPGCFIFWSIPLNKMLLYYKFQRLCYKHMLNVVCIHTCVSFNQEVSVHHISQRQTVQNCT
jgi:hypothetical protein